MSSDDDKIRLLSGLPIKFENRFIKQYSLKEIIELGIDDYYDKCFPFIMSLEFFGIENNSVKNFDIFWALQEKVLDKYLLEHLFEGLMFFFNTNKIKLNIAEMKAVIYDEFIVDDEFIQANEGVETYTNENGDKVIHINETIIDRNNFDKLSEKIRAITKTEKLKKQKEERPVNKHIEKLRANRKKFNNVKDVDASEGLCTIISYLVHFQEVLDYEKVLKLTMYQAKTSFDIFNKKDKFNINLNSYFAGAKINKKDLEHWAS